MAKKRDPKQKVLTTPARMIDGFVLFASDNVKRVNEQTFEVTSREGGKDVKRKVEILGDPKDKELYLRHVMAYNKNLAKRGLPEFKCSCEDYTYNAWTCSHIFAVAYWMQEKKELQRELGKPITVQFRPGCEKKGEYFTLFFPTSRYTSLPLMPDLAKLHCPFCRASLSTIVKHKGMYALDKRKRPRRGTINLMQCHNPECRGITRFSKKIKGKSLYCPYCGERGDTKDYYKLKMLLPAEYTIKSRARKR